VNQTRFPRRVYRGGTEPDPRFSLANERTFPAWVRTALALIACGVALEALTLAVQPALRRTAAILLLLLGLAVPLLARLTWASVERPLREARPLPCSKIALPVAVGVTAAGILILLGTLDR